MNTSMRTLLTIALASAPFLLGNKGCDNTPNEQAPGTSEAGKRAADEDASDTDDRLSEGCGGLRGAGCADGEYCNYPLEATCGAADQTGTCAPIPQVCTEQYAPVCGCDDKTYSNACKAASAGVSVAADGECDDEGGGDASCGGIAGVGCADGEYCNYPVEAMCGAADQTGTCAPIPEVCSEQYAPVCGCDDKTYSNSCKAASAGVSVLRTGTCEPSN